MVSFYNIFNECLNSVTPEIDKCISYKKPIRDPWVIPALRISSIKINQVFKRVCLLDHSSAEYVEYKKKMEFIM